MIKEGVKYNVLIGRFQPLTNAHIECAIKAKEKNGCDTILCMIDRPEEKMSEKNPFPTQEYGWMYEKGCRANPQFCIAGLVYVKNADFVKLSQMAAFQIAGWICGSDRYQIYKDMVEKYRDQIVVTPDFEVIEVERTGDDISATKARQALLDDDFETWKKITPFRTILRFEKSQEYVRRYNK